MSEHESGVERLRRENQRLRGRYEYWFKEAAALRGVLKGADARAPDGWLCVCYEDGIEVCAVNAASTRKEDAEAQCRYWHEPHKGHTAEVVPLYRVGSP